MQRILGAFRGFVFVASGLFLLQPAQLFAADTALPPLIDREIFFGDPDITAPQLSPDGTRVSFIRPHKGTRNIWVKRTDEPFSAAKPITAETTRPIAGYYWSRDGRYVLFIRDQGGDENFNMYAVNPDDAPAAGSDVPAARNLTNLPGVRVQIVAAPKTQPDIVYVGLNDRDKAWHDLYRVKISTGERELIRENKDRIAGYVFDVADQLRLAMRVADNGNTELLRIDPQGLTKIYECTVFENCAAIRFHKDGKRSYIVTNKGDVDLVGLALLDVQTGKIEPVESDPEKRVDFGSALFSEVTDELVGTAYVDDKVRVYWRDEERKAAHEFLKTKYPDREIAVPSRTKDERLALVALSADTEPGEYVLFDYDTRNITPQFRIRENLPREALASMQSIRYASSDGLQIPAYLTLPKGVAAKGLPLLVVPHGGPWARDMWGYNALPQFFANRGFAVLQPNFRASTGFGKKFLTAGNGEWGQKMQDDITWGVQHLVKQGIADPKRVAILGGSYGGYATLAGVAFTPDLYAAAVSIVGPSNLITLLNSIPAYWEAGRKQLYSRMADPTTPQGKALLEKQSPLNSAAKIKTPLLVVQGANDPRVKQAESDQIVVALRDRNFPVEYLVAPDEGHGFAKPENSLAMFAAAEKFLAKHISGIRHQADMKPEIASKLAAITVDPKTVKLTQKVDAANLSAANPVRPLQAGVSNYKVTMEMGAQKREVTSTTEIKRGEKTWTVTDQLVTPQGTATDTIELALDNLTLQRRSVAQGPLNLDFAVANGKATGEMKMNGQARPLSVDVGSGLFADGPGAAQVIGTLPLKEGYMTRIRNLNLLTQTANELDVSVAGSETVIVPAGTFDAWKVDAVGTDGTKMTIWIDKKSYRHVKTRGSSPQTGGGVLTQELVK